ncbi:MAG: HEAT repeat domain-containing protein [Ktedonobacterales bacterium]
MPSQPPPSRLRRSGRTYGITILLLATLGGLLAELGVVLVAGIQVGPLWAEAQTNPQAAWQAHPTEIGAVIGIPLVSALLVALLVWQAIRLVRLAIYTATLRRYLRRQLESYAPLYGLGVLPVGQRTTPQGRPVSTQVETTTHLFTATQRAMLLGEAGAGKTTALHAYGYHLVRRRALLPVFLGWAPLPVMVSLPGVGATLTPLKAHADDADTTPEALLNAYREASLSYIRARVKQFGTAGLANAAPRLVRRGKIVLLCDGLDETPDDRREVVSLSLATLAAKPYQRSRIVAACQINTYLTEPRDFNRLRQFDRILLNALRPDDMTQALRRLPLPKGMKRADLGAIRHIGEDHLLDPSLTLPAVFAALLRVQVDDDVIPYGRGKLLRAYAQNLCARAAGDSANPRQIALSLGALAASLLDARRFTLPLTPGVTLGVAVAEWLTLHPPIQPTDMSLATPLVFNANALGVQCRAALQAGVLRRSPDGLTISFAHGLLQEAFAAFWLSLRDDGLGRLNTELLRPHWIAPLLLWGGAKDDAADLAQRLFRFANSPDSVATRSGIINRQDVYPTALALALATLLEGVAPQIARLIAQNATRSSAFNLAQQHLRDLLDTALVYSVLPDQQRRLARTLQDVERDAGPEFVTHLTYLISLNTLDRLLRAQLITLLGLISTEAALQELVSMLGETDPTIRQAVNQGFAYAGAAATALLQAQLRSPNEYIRARATEALSRLSIETPDTSEATFDTAMHSLRSANPRLRASAAETLGSLRNADAASAVIALLDDSTSIVREAAARALGQIGGVRAREALRSFAGSADPALRIAIAQGLGVTPDPLSTLVALRLLTDTDPRVRAAAATTLGLLGDGRAVGPLRERCADADPFVQNAAISALRRLGVG